MKLLVRMLLWIMISAVIACTEKPDSPADAPPAEPPRPVIRNLPRLLTPPPKIPGVKVPQPLHDKRNEVLFAMIEKKDNLRAKELFAEGVPVDVQSETTGYTPYVIAAKACNVEMMKILDAQKANMTLQVYSSNTVLVSAYMNAAIAGCVDAVKYIVEEKKADINMRSNIWQETALYKAADGNYPALARYLLDKGIDTAIKNNLGKTALDRAREKGNTQIIAIIESFEAGNKKPK